MSNLFWLILSYPTNSTRLIHVSHNEASFDNSTCGPIDQPCSTFSYAQFVGIYGDTISLDRSYHYLNKGSIDIVDGDLELTSYCVDVSCSGKSTALINIEDSDDAIFYIISSGHLKISRLQIKANRNCQIIFYLNSGISSVELFDSILTTFPNPTFIMISNPSIDWFELIHFHNVTFGSYSNPFKEPFNLKPKSVAVAKNYRRKLLKSKTFIAKSRPRMLKSNHSSASSTIINITFTKIQNVNIRFNIDSSQVNIFLHQNVLKSTILSFDLSAKSNLNISFSDHCDSRISIVAKGYGLESTINISHVVSTCLGKRCFPGPLPDSGDFQLDISIEKTFGGNIYIYKCKFGSSTSGAVKITNASKVSISNSVFRDIRVTDTDLLSTNSAAGLTVISNRVALTNNQFQEISTPQNFPSSLYIQIIPHKHIRSGIIMTNLAIDTTTFQDWKNDLLLHIKVDSKQIIRRSNVTVRCLKGDQYMKKSIVKSGEAIIQCTRCETSSYNVLPPTLTWHQDSKFEYNNVCHHPCPYQASCDTGLKSLGNYWGQVQNKNSTQGTVSFFLCPTYYCCSSKDDCTSYDTCANNLQGRLCGDCIYNHSIALFGPNQCVLTENCKPNTFWAGYVFSIIAVYLVVLFYKDIFFSIRKLLLKIYTRLNRRPLRNVSSRMNEDQSSVFEPLLYDERENDESISQASNTEHTSVRQISGLIKLAFSSIK